MNSISSCKFNFYHSNITDIILEDKTFKGYNTKLKNLIYCVCQSSPFLKGIIIKEKNWLLENIDKDVQVVFDDLLRFETTKNIFKINDIYNEIIIIKRKAILLIALADFGGIWSLQKITSNLSKLADELLNFSLDNLSLIEIKKNSFNEYFKNKKIKNHKINGAAKSLGLVVLSLGKLGSNELNYSSDIDLIFFFDETLFFPKDYEKVRKKFIQIVRNLIKIFSIVDESGLVYRVDLRLRPDPSSNPICIGLGIAENYYESYGRTWERAAFIKARAIAGDKMKGYRFLKNLEPFIWRKYLDFNTFNEINELREQSLEFYRLKGKNQIEGFNFKLGKGGIRDIEFFAQTNQLVWGGKEKEIRKTSTIKALKALLINNKISKERCDSLIKSYTFFRKLEHCFQLLNNNQTHTFPIEKNSIRSVLLLMRVKDKDKFYKKIYNNIESVKKNVKEIYKYNKIDEQSLYNCELDKNLNCREFLKKWDTYQALRSQKARRLFLNLKPLISKKIFDTERPFETLYQFDRFLSKLPSGIQIFSLFNSNHSILYMIIDIFSAAPSFANYLGSNVNMIEYLLDSNFYSPLENLNNLESELSKKLNDDNDYEEKLDTCRLWVKEKQFRSGVHLILGISSISEVSKSFSNIAEACIKRLFKVVLFEFSKRYGSIPKVNISILTMGKLASKEMTFSSDLDLIFIYEPFKNKKTFKNKTFSDNIFYTRLAQFFISSLTVSTSKGNLYKVDMRLRPSGRQGPVASSLPAFINYQKKEAWIWEKLALSRSRVISGHKKLKKKIIEARKEILNTNIDELLIKKEVSEMRSKIFLHGSIDETVLEVKKGRGKLLDLELLIQMGIIKNNIVELKPLEKIIKLLEEKKFFSNQESMVCSDAYKFFTEIQQVSRLIIKEKIKLDKNSDRYELIFKKYFHNLSIENIFKKVSFYSLKVDFIFKNKLK